MRFSITPCEQDKPSLKFSAELKEHKALHQSKGTCCRSMQQLPESKMHLFDLKEYFSSFNIDECFSNNYQKNMLVAFYSKKLNAVVIKHFKSESFMVVNAGSFAWRSDRVAMHVIMLIMRHLETPSNSSAIT